MKENKKKRWFECKCRPNKNYIGNRKPSRFKVYAENYQEALSIADNEIFDNYGEDAYFWYCDCWESDEP